MKEMVITYTEYLLYVFENATFSCVGQNETESVDALICTAKAALVGTLTDGTAGEEW